jgi:4-hydroxy-tetrahydrodipicolinate synthase
MRRKAEIDRPRAYCKLIIDKTTLCPSISPLCWLATRGLGERNWIQLSRRRIVEEMPRSTMMNVGWQGVFAAATTQFRDDGSLDIPSTAVHLHHMIDAGVHGLIMLGTVGENCSLEYGEKLDLLSAVVDRVDGRVPVLSGVAECTTALACRFAIDAKRVGVSGLMVLPAMIYKSDRRETIAHFRAVAHATDLDIMVYNNPVSYGVDITPDMLVELANEPRFVAIKESSENVRRITDLKNACGNRYVLFCGVDDLVLESVLLGASGWVSGLVNAFPAENRLLWDLATTGRWIEAREVYRWYTPLLHLDTHVKLVQYIKLAQQECGLGSEIVRAPRLPLAGAEREEVLAVIRRGIASRPTQADAAPHGR